MTSTDADWRSSLKRWSGHTVSRTQDGPVRCLSGSRKWSAKDAGVRNARNASRTAGGTIEHTNLMSRVSAGNSFRCEKLV